MAEQPAIRAETVNALLDVTWRLLGDEHEREGSVNLRGVAVAGFAGVVVGVTASVAKEALSPRLPPAWRWATLAVFAAALLVLAAVIVYTLLAVLLPRDRPTLGVEEAERYPTLAAVTRPVEIEQGRVMNGLVTALAEARELNDSKARALRYGYCGLAVGCSSCPC